MNKLIFASVLVLASFVVPLHGAPPTRMEVDQKPMNIDNFPAVKNVFVKLEQMSQYNLPSSRLTLQELKAAYEVFRTWTEEQQDQFRAEYRLNGLIIDFVLIPMDRFDDLIGDATYLHGDYITRMEIAYKRFRTGYMGGYVNAVGGKVTFYRTPKNNALVSSLRREQGSKPLTLKLFQDAARETSAYLNKIQEIPLHEDVYSTTNLEEMTNLMNSVNREPIKTLRQVIYPEIGKVRNERDLERLRDAFNYIVAQNNIRW